MQKLRFISILLVVLLTFSVVVLPTYRICAETSLAATTEITASDYGSYIAAHCDASFPNEKYTLSAENATNLDSEIYFEDKEKSQVVFLKESGNSVSWNFNVANSGLYNISVCYKALDTSNGDIAFSLKCNGEIPFDDASSLTLPRIWKDKKVERNDNADDVRSSQIQLDKWQTKYLKDITGLYSSPYQFYFEAGANSIEIVLNNESLYISDVVIENPDKTLSYEDYLKIHSSKEKVRGETIRLEAEDVEYKSSSMIYPTYDRTSAATLPNNPLHIRLNTIGGTNWANQGQSVTWKANVEKAGLYKICFRAKQENKQGLSSYRTLYINSKVPFLEAESIAFNYKDGWYNKVLGDDTPYYIYLENGDEITLECTSGPTDMILQSVNTTVAELNEIYRNIIKITGTNPDPYRDYSLTSQIPDLLERIKKSKKDITSAYSQLLNIAGQDAAQASSMNKLTNTLQKMLDEPNTIAERLTSYLEDVQGVATLIKELGNQPLELDCIAFVTEDGKTPRINARFFDWLDFGIKRFFASFSEDYIALENSANDTLDVWLATGRDQANVISDVTKDMYTSKTGVAVKFALVDTGNTLIKAVLAGKGPDAAIMIPMSSPINLAMRGALVELNALGLKKEYIDGYLPSAWEPFKYNGGIYAIPESQSYDMLFYRKDVLKEYALGIPNTWDEFYEIMRVIQNNNLIVGLPESQNTFNYFLFQNGGKYYNENLDATTFDSEVANIAFEKWTQLYSKYSINRSVDFFNRFRSGEMPIGISSYTLCNQLYSAAPELNGLWEMAPLPGTVDESGNVNRTQASAMTGAIVIKTGKGKKQYKKAFDFVSWWAGEDAQTRYSMDIESVLGVASRYTPANLNAFGKVNWSVKEKQTLSEQLIWLYNNPEIPGNYIVSRCLSNAFRSVVDDAKNARRQLSIYNIDMNEEIARKRKEFNPEKR